MFADALIYALVAFIAGILGNLIAGWIQNNYFTNPVPRIRLWGTIGLAAIAIVVMAALELPSSPDLPSLYILEQRDRADTFLVAGTAVSDYKLGDALVVYGETIPDVEEPIALLRVVTVNPDSLTAQIVLHNPEQPIYAHFRVDGQIEQLNRGEMVPYEDSFAAYFIGGGQIRIRPGSNIAVNALLQAYEPAVVDGFTLDHVKMSPAVQVRVTDVGVQQTIAVTSLEEGDWPPIGTVLALIPEVSPAATAVPTPTNQPTPLPTPTETPYAGPCSLESLEALPSSPQPVGTAVTIKMRGVCDTGVRAIRLFINGEYQDEKGGHIAPPEEFNYFWQTAGLEPGNYLLKAEVATWGDDDWQFTSSKTLTYTLSHEDVSDWIELIGPSNNGGFETGDVSLWLPGEGVFEVSSEEPHSGNFAVRGTPAIEGWFYREISVQQYHTQIDSSLGKVSYGVWFQTGGSENFRLILQFLDSSGNVIGDDLNSGWLTSNSADNWKYEERVVNIPVSTDKIRLEIHVKRQQYDFTDVDIDDVTLRLHFASTLP
ncbi:MAG: hypothetical protein KDE56_00830 [Anaerolineales bacterium]|nr:hypothetical protein [Anaerolineales bacterium]MCB8992272.1 hypothetical protein [Ardenticatenaceae bacterium]